jgi:hypothetical protein
MYVSFVAPVTVRDHFVQFTHLAGFSSSLYSFFKIIWLACVWVIWKERNNRVFNQKALDSQATSDKVKLISYILGLRLISLPLYLLTMIGGVSLYVSTVIIFLNT